MKIEEIKQFVEAAIIGLRESKNFAQDYCNLKMEFFRTFQDNLVFSTRFGADFFNEVKAHLDNPGLNLKPIDKVLGEYDKNFNLWLDKVHKKS